MNAPTFAQLGGTLGELSRLYPGIRFGQILEMVALFASDHAPEPVEAVNDDRLLQAAEDHLAVRRQQFGSGNKAPLPATRVVEDRDLLAHGRGHLEGIRV